MRVPPSMTYQHQGLLATVKKAQKKPKVALRGYGGQAYTFLDLFGHLGPRQCHLIKDGRVYEGEARRTNKQNIGRMRTRTHMYQVVIARYPVMFPGDVTIRTSKKVDPSVKYAPRGRIVSSAADHSIAALGDGDWDGDQQLVRNVSLTARTYQGYGSPQIRNSSRSLRCRTPLTTWTSANTRRRTALYMYYMYR